MVRASQRSDPQAFDRARDQSIETVGRVAEFWGFTRTQGRVFGALFLSAQPMTQAMLTELLGVSAANVSMSLTGLLRWGAVKKAYNKGSRKLHYEAEPEIRKIVRNVLGGREKQELSEAVEILTDAVEDLKRERSLRPLTPDEEFAQERIQHLAFVARTSNRLLELLLGEGRVDLSRELSAAKHTPPRS
jgi:DNA-binding transcriptional regulator GbsR (MarR family)